MPKNWAWSVAVSLIGVPTNVAVLPGVPGVGVSALGLVAVAVVARVRVFEGAITGVLLGTGVKLGSACRV